MNLYNTSHLEDAFYDLCRKQDLALEADQMTKAGGITNKDSKEHFVQRNTRKIKFNRNVFQLKAFAIVAKRTWCMLAFNWFNLFMMLIYR